MAEMSRSQVTITLGRSGQVVKRAGVAADDGSFFDSQPLVGSKRSVRDRLGSNVDSQFNNKRQRGDASRLSLSASNDVDGNRFTISSSTSCYTLTDVCLTKDDLRFKIMRKNSLKRSQSNRQQNGVDLRDLLSRPGQSSTSTLGTQQQMPQLKETRKYFPDPRDDRQHMQEPRNARFMPEPMNGRQRLSQPRDARQRLPEPPRDGRHVMPEEVRNVRLGSVSSSLPRQIPSSRSKDALTHMGSLRNSYSSWTLDNLRQRSSERIPGTSRGLSPPMRNEEQEGRPLVRAYDDSRVTSYMSKDAFEHSRPMRSAPYQAKIAQTAGAAKSMAPPLHLVPPSVTLVQKSSYTVDDQPTIDSFLQSLGLEKYSINFKAEEVDMYTLNQMADRDLKELGIPMGPRKKILLALLSRAKRQI